MKRTLIILLSVVAVFATFVACEAAGAETDDPGNGENGNGDTEEITGGEVVDGALIVGGRLSEIDFPDGYAVPAAPTFNLRIDKPTSTDPDNDSVSISDTDGGDDFRMEYSETPPDLQNVVDWLEEPGLTVSNTNAQATDAIVLLVEPNGNLVSLNHITIDAQDGTMYYQIYVYVSEATSITGTITANDGLEETFDLSLVPGWNVVIASENDTSNTSTIGATVPDGLEGAWFAEN